MQMRTQPEIIPAIFATDAREFETQIRAVERLTPLAHIDVIDGSWISGRTWADPFNIGELISPLHYELHLMVADPLAHIAAWETMPAVQRVIAHIEVAPNPRELISTIRFHGWEAALAINPDTILDSVLAYEEYADEIMFMAVMPGATGRACDDRVLQKIHTFCAAAPHAMVGVDGCVNEQTLPRFIHAGAQRLRVHSALFSDAHSVQETWRELTTVASHA